MAYEGHTKLFTLYNPRTRKVLGKGARWVTPEEFHRNPPQSTEDFRPDDNDRKPVDPSQPGHTGDPGPHPACINGLVHVCWTFGGVDICFLCEPQETC